MVHSFVSLLCEANVLNIKGAALSLISHLFVPLQQQVEPSCVILDTPYP